MHRSGALAAVCPSRETNQSKQLPSLWARDYNGRSVVDAEEIAIPGGSMRAGLVVTVAVAILLQAPLAQADKTVRVAYAGSMGVVMDRVLGPAFARVNGVVYQGIGQGAYGLARLLAAKQMQADVFVSITPGPVKVLEDAGLLTTAAPVASTEMVITYTPKSRFAPQLAAAAMGRTVWWRVLEAPGLRFGRTDPAVDPQGQNIIFTMLLAERYYDQSDLVAKILGAYQNPTQIFTEPSLLSRLEGGQIDASSGYQSAATSQHLPYIALPDEINLSNPAKFADWYSKVTFTIKLPSGKDTTLRTQPLVFYAGVLKNAQQQDLGKKFVQFMLSLEGQKALRDAGYAAPKGGAT
jgi:molybdate/tungstate transport system substrate-binding protein